MTPPADTGAPVDGDGRAIAGAGPDGFFGVRFESIGGLGAHLAGQILAESGVLCAGLNGSHFSSYGSEKKGSPLQSYVRFCEAGREIRRSDPIERPQVVVVFHQALVASGNVTAGLVPYGTIILNTTVDPGEMYGKLGIGAATVGTVDALAISVEESTRVNTAMMGAAARACPFIDPEAIRKTLAGRLGHRYPELVEANLRSFDRGYDEIRFKSFAGASTGAEPGPSGQEPVRVAPSYGYLEAPPGGVILQPGSTVVRNLSASREGFVAQFDPGKCTDCGICDAVCPDICFVWEVEPDGLGEGAVHLSGIDYHYCKGCLKCTEQCPTGALTVIREEDGWAEANRIPLYPWLETEAAL